MQGLKFSGAVPDLQRVAFGCEKKKKIVLHLKKLVDIMFEFTAFTLNQTNITSQSEVVALINRTRKIVSRAAALLIEKKPGSWARHAEKAVRRNG